MSRTVTDKNRRNISLRKSNIREVLPEYYTNDYPNLVLFLEKYYQFLESDEDEAFDKTIQNMFNIRDVTAAPVTFLDYIIRELGANVVNVNTFINPRFAARLLQRFLVVKGSLYSIEGWFKSVYGVDPEVVYPKEKLMILNDPSRVLGPSNANVLQDGLANQVLSIKVKSSVPFNTWSDLWKKIGHPAGFFLSGETLIVGQATAFTNPMPDMPSLGIAAPIPQYEAEAGVSVSTTLFGDTTGLIDSDAQTFRIDFDKTINLMGTATVTVLNNDYNNILQAAQEDSRTFDDTDLTMSNAIETMDRDVYTS